MINDEELNARKVQFNSDAVAGFNELKEKGVISQKFGDFVRSQFHKRIDELKSNISSVDVTNETIEDLTKIAVVNETKKAN